MSKQKEIAKETTKEIAKELRELAVAIEADAKWDFFSSRFRTVTRRS